MNPRRIDRSAIIIKPSTLLRFHRALENRKYRLLYSARNLGKPGPKGPARKVIDAILEIKRRNPRFGCPRIAQQINLAFGLDIDKDIVRRVLANYFTPDRGDGSPSWLYNNKENFRWVNNVVYTSLEGDKKNPIFNEVNDADLIGFASQMFFPNLFGLEKWEPNASFIWGDSDNEIDFNDAKGWLFNVGIGSQF